MICMYCTGTGYLCGLNTINGVRRRCPSGCPVPVAATGELSPDSLANRTLSLMVDSKAQTDWVSADVAESLGCTVTEAFGALRRLELKKIVAARTVRWQVVFSLAKSP